MLKKNKPKIFIISIYIFLSIIIIPYNVKAQKEASVRADVLFNGENYPINYAKDKTEIFEQKYGEHTIQDKIVSESLLLLLEIVFFLLLLKIYQIINHELIKHNNIKIK